MLASSGRPFDSSNHLYEIKWDGIRVLAFFGKGRIRLQTRRLLDTTHRYPEIVRALRELPGEGILDGEVVVFDGDKPSFERALKRELVSDPTRIAQRARDIPAYYVAFDLLYLDGCVLMEEPLSERKRLLSKLLTEKSAQTHHRVRLHSGARNGVLPGSCRTGPGRHRGQDSRRPLPFKQTHARLDQNQSPSHDRLRCLGNRP